MEKGEIRKIDKEKDSTQVDSMSMTTTVATIMRGNCKSRSSKNKTITTMSRHPNRASTIFTTK